MCSFQPQLTWHCTHPHFNWRHHTLLESYSILFYSLLLSGCTVSDSSIALTLICIFFGTNAAAGSQTVISRWELRAEGANSYANLCYTRNHEMLIRNNKLSLRQRLSLFIVSLQNWDFLYFLHHSAQMCSNFENIFKKFPSKLETSRIRVYNPGRLIATVGNTFDRSGSGWSMRVIPCRVWV